MGLRSIVKMARANICDVLKMTTALDEFVQKQLFHISNRNTDAARDYRLLAESTIDDLKTVARDEESDLRVQIVSELQSRKRMTDVMYNSLGGAY